MDIKGGHPAAWPLYELPPFLFLFSPVPQFTPILSSNMSGPYAMPSFSPVEEYDEFDFQDPFTGWSAANYNDHDGDTDLQIWENFLRDTRESSSPPSSLGSVDLIVVPDSDAEESESSDLGDPEIPELELPTSDLGEPSEGSTNPEGPEIIDLTLSDSESESADRRSTKRKAHSQGSQRNKSTNPEGPEIIDLTLSDSESESADRRSTKRKAHSQGSQRNKRTRATDTYDPEPNLRASKAYLCFKDETVEYCWNSRAKGWKTEATTLTNLTELCSENLLSYLCIDVLANGDGIAVPLRWDEEEVAFVGSDPMGFGGEFRVSRMDMEKLLLTPERSQRVAWME
ncbi:hypothetical protein F5Y06DRAFT_94521 [Hypoxylon sp. FL0890]|nr:hypothetical protein F5Y06DRAFT_94521 [Hypoxylon sp. FL0890]